MGCSSVYGIKKKIKYLMNLVSHEKKQEDFQ